MTTEATESGGDVAPSGPPARWRPHLPGRGNGAKMPFWVEMPLLLVIAFVVAVLVKTFLVQAFFIPSGSMEPTLHGCTGCSGDRVLVNKLVYDFHDPRPGDIVVFEGPESWQEPESATGSGNPVTEFFTDIGRAVGLAQPSEKDFVKRVIAVGGQTVSCCDAHGNVQVDGRSLDEPYVAANSPDVDSTLCGVGRKFGPITVPKGRLWVMGDNRADSSDSRCHVTDQWHGTIGVDNVIGKAFVRIWPISRWGTLGSAEKFQDSAGPLDPRLLVLPLTVGLVVVGREPWIGRRRRSSRWPAWASRRHRR